MDNITSLEQFSERDLKIIKGLVCPPRYFPSDMDIVDWEHAEDFNSGKLILISARINGKPTKKIFLSFRLLKFFLKKDLITLSELLEFLDIENIPPCYIDGFFLRYGKFIENSDNVTEELKLWVKLR